MGGYIDKRIRVHMFAFVSDQYGTVEHWWTSQLNALFSYITYVPHEQNISFLFAVQLLSPYYSEQSHPNPSTLCISNLSLLNHQAPSRILEWSQLIFLDKSCLPLCIVYTEFFKENCYLFLFVCWLWKMGYGRWTKRRQS